jgi:hypothetical protein
MSWAVKLRFTKRASCATLRKFLSKNIFPFAVVKTKDLNKQGFHFVIEQFMKELACVA